MNNTEDTIASLHKHLTNVQVQIYIVPKGNSPEKVILLHMAIVGQYSLLGNARLFSHHETAGILLIVTLNNKPTLTPTQLNKLLQVTVT